LQITQQVKMRKTEQDNAAITFGRFLKQWRISAGKNQTELGKNWGKSQSSVSDYEQGTKNVERQDLESLAVALGKPFADVLEAWIQCQRATGETSPTGAPFFYLPSGRKAYIETPDGNPMALTPDDLVRLDLELSILEQRKQRGQV
jgi:transcriptional regulator with XRE-family HTH domain